MQPERGGGRERAMRLDGVALARARARLCAGGQAPWLHGEAARRMAERLPLIRRQPACVLDWSGPLGASEEVLRQAYPRARQLVVEIADWPRLALPSPRRRLAFWPRAGGRVQHVAEAEVGAGQAGLLWSNMLLQACEDPPALLLRWQQALAVEGFLMFSTLGPGTLPELRQVYRLQGWGEPLAPFVDMHDFGDMLVHAGFADPVMDQEIVTLTWPDADALLAELRALGANLSPHRHQGLRTRHWREHLRAALAGQSQHERLRLSFELVYGHAFKAPPRAPVRASRSKA